MIAWIKQNKVVTAFIVLLLVFIIKDKLLGYNQFSLSSPTIMRQESLDYATDSVAPLGMTGGGVSEAGMSAKIGMVPPFPPIYNDAAPTTGVVDRITITDTSLSLVVTDVRNTLDTIVAKAKEFGGYMVNSSLSSPEEAPYASVTLRVPSEKREEALNNFRGLAYKVTSENVNGTDVTDEYVDIEAQLATLQETKVKFESILKSSTEIEDILRVQQEIINLQSQMDSYKGRQKYLTQNADLSKITIYLSTDELSLPYTPTNRFRPNVIAKLALRSLVQHLQGFGETLIWIGVYSLVWLPVLIVGIFLYRRFTKPQTISKSN